jgi:hypothetical protein
MEATMERAEWEAYLRKIREWKQKCEVMQAEVDRLEDLEPCGIRRLSKMIRRLAKINGGKGSSGNKGEFASGGKDGPRGCGPALWDNAIRAMEEDR